MKISKSDPKTPVRDIDNPALFVIINIGSDLEGIYPFSSHGGKLCPNF